MYDRVRLHAALDAVLDSDLRKDGKYRASVSPEEYRLRISKSPDKDIPHVSAIRKVVASRKTVEIPVSKLRAWQWYVRPEDVHALAEKSKSAPIIVSPAKGGLFNINDGHHRACAAILKGAKTLRAYVVPRKDVNAG